MGTMSKEEILKILEDAKDKNSDVPMRLVRQAFEKLPEPCENTVSRQAAIDVEGLDEEIRCEMCRNPMHTNRGCDGNCKYDEKLYEKIIQLLDKRITPLPSAQTEQRWIPVTERLPKKPNMYTVTDSKGDVVRFVYTGTDSSRKYWLRCAKAWMPLPEPYREDS